MDEKMGLYAEYLKDLEKIRKKKFGATKKEKEAWCQAYIDHWDRYTWLSVMDDDECVGFVIIDTARQEGRYFIEQAFVKEGHRRKGLLKQAFQPFLFKHTGDYELLVIEGNSIAEATWQSIFYMSGYHDVRTPVQDDEGIRYTQYLWIPNAR